MAEKDLLIKEKVESTGLFDFGGFYSYAYGWFKYEEYVVIEEEYTEKVSGNEREMIIKWKARKKLSDYFTIDIAIKYEIRNMVDVEVEIDGKKKKMNKGRITAEIKGTLIKDSQSGWETSNWYKFLREIYDKYVIPGRIENMEEKVFKEVWDFKDALRSYLQLSVTKR